MKCCGCGKKILTRIGAVVMPDKRWHRKCFKCKTCGLQLDVKSCEIRDESVYCLAHFTQQFLHHTLPLPQPRNYPYGIVPESTYAELQPEWYHDALSRADAEDLLRNDGDFLVRTSVSKPGEFILSVKWQQKCIHFHIPRDRETSEFIVHSTTVQSVKEWVELLLLSDKPVSKNTTAIIKTPVKRRQTQSGLQRSVSAAALTSDAAAANVLRRPLSDLVNNRRHESLCDSDIVKVVSGSVCDQKVEAIVNSTSQLLNLQSGALSRAILEKAGQEIQQELSSLASADVGSGRALSIFITKGYNLPCRYVVHVVFSPNQDKTVRGFQLLARSIFTKLQELNVRSVAIPPVGTGGFGYQTNVVTKMLCEEAAFYLETTTNPSLKDIRFIVLPTDKIALNALRRELEPDEVQEDEYGYVQVRRELQDLAITFAASKLQARKIVHRAGSVVKLPANWSSREPTDSYRKIELDRNSDEYQSVVMSMSIADRDLYANLIYKIERVESSLYEMYEVSKLLMSRNARSQDVANLERNLWHGTGELALASICHFGFNRSYCGRLNGNKYGKGVYYAQEFQYSANDCYSIPDKAGLKRVLRCRVLTGQFTRGHEDMIEPPFIPDNAAGRYDSTVDDVSNPTVFVIYADYHSYPEYIVTFFGNLSST